MTPALAPKPSAEERSESPRPRPSPSAIPEFSDAAALPRGARATLWALLGLVISAVIWCTVAQLDIVVSAPGVIATDRQLMVVQPFELSIIRDIPVRVGDVVKEGQTLVTLDSTLVQADTADAESKLAAAAAKLARADAELAGREYAPAVSNKAVEIEREVFRQRQAEVKARLSLSEQKIRDLQSQLDAKRAEEPALRKELEIQQQAVAIYETLRVAGNTSLLKELDAKRTAAELTARITENIGAQQSLKEQISTLRSEYESFISERRRQLIEDYAKTKVEYDEAAASISKGKLRGTLVELKAPADGTVLEVAQRAIGSIVRQAETVVTLVPKHAELLADLKVETRDIGLIKVGDPVVLKLEALPFTKYGYLEGTLKIIAPDVVDGQDRGEQGQDGGNNSEKSSADREQAFYRARVSIDKSALRNVPDSFSLRPGMKITADVTIGERSVLEYIVTPFSRALQESMRER